jgi:hypothetical protein
MSITEEIWAESDGAGKYHLTIDMSQAIDFIKMAFGDLDGFTQDTTGIEEPLEKVFGNLFNGTFHGDTTITSDDIIKELEESGGDVSQVPEDFGIKMHFDTIKTEMFITLMFEYKSIEEFKKSNLLNGDMSLLKGLTGPDSLSSESLYYSISDGIFSRKGLELESSELFEKASDDELQMMNSMFPGTKYTTIIHLPGKVESVSNPKAVIDGNSVILETLLVDMINSKKTEDLEIKYKD